MNRNAVLLAASVVGWIGVILWSSPRWPGGPDGGPPRENAYAQPPLEKAPPPPPVVRTSLAAPAPGGAEYDYGLGNNHVSRLMPYPKGGPGTRTPFDLWRYAGKGESSWKSPVLPVSWEEWVAKLQKQKPELMADVRAYMDRRYHFHGGAIAGARMSGGKPIMRGPVARLPGGVSSFEALARLSPGEINRRDLFPYKPLAHPLQTTAHMLFPESWLAVHPEHRRMDVDMDLPDAYLPEYPPPLFLTTHKELGDVSGGREITLENYYDIFNGLLTGEQMEGLKELLRPTPTDGPVSLTARVVESSEDRATVEGTLFSAAGKACASCRGTFVAVKEGHPAFHRW